jgi:hypothetical protein
MQHIGKNAMLRPLRSISVKCLPILGTIFEPKTLQNELWDPIEKNTKFEHPSFQFFLDSGSPWGPNFGPKRAADSYLFQWGFQLGAEVGPGTPQDTILVVFWPFLEEFLPILQHVPRDIAIFLVSGGSRSPPKWTL